MDLKAFKTEKDKLSKALEKHSRTMLVEEFKKFFKTCPEAVAIRWTQYTPHFNDGDVCEFARHEFEVTGNFKDQLKDPTENNDDDNNEEEYTQSYYLEPESNVSKAINKLEDGLEDTYDVFKAAFGDGVQVVCTRKGFEVEEYDHD